jgi:hypothetical protein
MMRLILDIFEGEMMRRDVNENKKSEIIKSQDMNELNALFSTLSPIADITTSLFPLHTPTLKVIVL